MLILLIEDDAIIGDGIHAGLQKLGFAVDWFRDGRDGYEAPNLKAYDAVILDLSLPGMDGLDILKGWRKSGRSEPVLILTARGALEQRIEGLNLGADDYLPKPFALEEVAARLRSLVRRNAGMPKAVLEHGPVCFYPDTRIVALNGKPISLSPKETLLVEMFLLSRSSVLSRSVIEDKIYPWGEEVSSNAVEVHVHHVRRKLGAWFISTVHGLGYKLGDPQC